MTEEPRNLDRDPSSHGEFDRREFVAMSVGLAATAGTGAAQALDVVETNVEIKTPDGVCDGAFIHPRTGAHPAVLIWTDAFGLRPAFRDMGKRLAAQGYSVLVPNPFYRISKSPQFTDVTSFSFQNPEDRAKIQPLMGSIGAEGAAEKDAAVFVAWLDSQPQVDRTKKMGTQGYCMGGPLIMRTAASQPERIGAAASFHGGGLVTNNANSPHLMIPRMKARLYIAIAANDDAQQPTAKDTLREAFAAANVRAEIEVYSMAQHGWCVPDMPQQNGASIYKRDDAERAWNKLLELYKAALA